MLQFVGATSNKALSDFLSSILRVGLNTYFARTEDRRPGPGIFRLLTSVLCPAPISLLHAPCSLLRCLSLLVQLFDESALVQLGDEARVHELFGLPASDLGFRRRYIVVGGL